MADTVVGPTIIVKKGRPKDFRKFFGPLDKGANKPSFCYPGRIERLREEVSNMEKALDNKHVPPDHEQVFRQRFKTRKERLDKIMEHSKEAKAHFNEDPDYWKGRFTELKEEIRKTMPSRKDVKEKRVNPHSVLKQEKSGFEEKKREFMVLGKLLEEETNISHLQRN